MSMAIQVLQSVWGYLVQVVEWVLGGVRTEWQSPAFQAGVDSPAAFIGHYFNLHADAGGNVEVCSVYY